MNNLQKIESEEAPVAVGPYSQAVWAGDYLFCSGQVALDKEGKLIGDNITNQTEQVLKNLGAVLVAADLTYSDVVRSDVFLTNIESFSELNIVYGKYFTSYPEPARQTVEVSRLPKGALVEISCVAYKPKDQNYGK
ncbi:MAG: Rid family detoxifying hydrolase [bacterium]